MPEKIIVGIGGGERGKVKSDGTHTPYELGPQDAEIVRLCGKPKPHVLYLGQAQADENKQRKEYELFSNIYTKRLKCVTRQLHNSEITGPDGGDTALAWADIIYVGGGDTVGMINFWRKYGLDAKLRAFWESGKILSGTSAGANCWFTYYCTDCVHDADGNPGVCEGLGFIDALFVPHCDDPKREAGARSFLMSHPMTALLVSNCAALVIEGGRYRAVLSDASFHGSESFFRTGRIRAGAYESTTPAPEGDFASLFENN